VDGFVIVRAQMEGELAFLEDNWEIPFCTTCGEKELLVTDWQ